MAGSGHLLFSYASSLSSSGTVHFSRNVCIFFMYLAFMCAVFAGFSVFRKMANSFSMVSLTVKVGYFSLYSPISLRPLVTTDPRACSKKVIEFSSFCKLYSKTGFSSDGILTGSLVLA